MLFDEILDKICDYEPEFLQTKQELKQCQEINEILHATLDNEIKKHHQLNQKLDLTQQRIQGMKAEVALKCTLIKELNARLAQVPPAQILPKAVREHQKKYPHVFITFPRPIPHSTQTVQVDVRHFITPQDNRIQGWVENRKLEIKDPWNCNDQIIKLYREDRKTLKYTRDTTQFGISEMWLYPHELLALGKGDCEDYAHLLASRMIAAGLPPQRIRVVAGLVNSRQGGHSTIYILNDNLKTWHHFNSTGSYKGKHFKDYPTSKDTTDRMGIHGAHTWLSYDNQRAYSTFRTDLATESYYQEPLSNKLVIKRCRQ